MPTSRIGAGTSKRLSASKKKVVKESRKRNIFLLSILLVLVFGFIAVLKLFSFENSNYSENFSHGKDILYYTKNGVYESGNNSSLISGNVMSYGQPVLSPDNTKIAYYLGDSPYDLYLYDINSKSTTKIASQVNLYEGYLQTPVWIQDSSGVFVTFQESGGNKLYLVDLNGNKTPYAENISVYWPQVIDNNLLSYNITLPDTNSVGIVNLSQNTNIVFSTNATTYFTKVEKFGNTILNIGNPGLSSEGGSYTQNIYALNTLDLKTQKTEYFPIPESLQEVQGFKRIQPVLSCDGRIILGRVVEDTATGTSFGESYNAFYTYDPEHKKAVQILQNADMETLQTLSYPTCIGNYMYYPDLNNGLKVNYLNLQTNSLKRMDFLPVLSQSVQEGIQKQCLYSTVDYIAGFSEDSTFFITVSPSYDISSNKACVGREALVGIYRVANGNNAEMITQEVKEDIFQQSFLLPPNK